MNSSAFHSRSLQATGALLARSSAKRNDINTWEGPMDLATSLLAAVGTLPA